MYPISIKGVLFVEGKVVLLKNERNEWELPGGRLDLGETQEEALVREFKEELSIGVEPLDLLDSYLFEVIPGRQVSIVTYGCRLIGEFAPAISKEHMEFGLHGPADLGRIALPAGYARSINAWRAHAKP